MPANVDKQSLRGFLRMVEQDFPDEIVRIREPVGLGHESTALVFEGCAPTNGAIDQSNFDSYPVTRMNEAPNKVNVYIVESDAPPAGVGEPGVPPFAPALCNAIFSATGKRIRELPISKTNLAA